MEYDLIIIGAGPAGMSAAIYAGRYLLKTLVLGEITGGLAAQAHEICNFLTQKKIKGYEFAKMISEHVNDLGVKVKSETVIKLTKHENFFEVETNNTKYAAKKIIIATGTKHRHLNLKEEKGFLGKGVSYCATCDSAFFKDKVTAVVGGSDAALTSALLLAQYSTKVYIIYRKNQFFRAEPTWVKLVEENEKIQPIFNANIAELIGDNFLKQVKLDTGMILDINGLFIEIGSDPRTELVEDLDVELDGAYIKVDKYQKTNIPGVFAAGDVCNNPLKQIITSAGHGAVAAFTAFEEIKKKV